MAKEKKPKKDIRNRPPVVTMMGHVDHGKTSLLDIVRKSRITAGEYGEITQHVGAYAVNANGHAITFLDTPGHEAFTAMRSRGADVTDIVVLVVSLEDGPMPQTIEAINHCHAAKVPVIVALNKVDLPTARANIDRVKGQLAEHNILSEDMGGQNLFVETSALSRQGVDKLLEAILLQAEMLELKADYAGPAEGVVIESMLMKGTGPNITLLLRKGTLKPRQAFTAGETSGKVRLLVDDTGKTLPQLTPGLPGRVVGADSLPMPGELFRVFPSEKEARRVLADEKKNTVKESESSNKSITLEEFYARINPEEKRELNVILKTDVPGSMEALVEGMKKMNTDEVSLNFIMTGIGDISESDVQLAADSGSIIFGFNIGIDAKTRSLADREKVQVRRYRVIYELLEDVRMGLSGLLAPEIKEVTLGQATVKEVFTLSDGQVIAGCSVSSGKITRNSKARLSRKDELVSETFISSLRRFKENVREVSAGYECGIGLQGIKELEPGDTITTYSTKEVTRSL